MSPRKVVSTTNRNKPKRAASCEEALQQRISRAKQIDRRLSKAYPKAHCTLDFKNPLQLLVATILAAQCTDQRVNIVTRTLFRKYRCAEDYAQADPAVFQREITSVGFFRNKTKSVLGCAQALLECHAGQVPRTMSELVALPGVGRKTANVILGDVFGIPGLVVDTHVGRLAGRLGLSSQKTPEKIEQDLMKIVAQDRWAMFSHLLVFHGRNVCLARKPRCEQCTLSDLCPSVGLI